MALLRVFTLVEYPQIGWSEFTMFPLSKMLKSFVKVGSLTVIDAEGGTHVFAGGPGPEVTMRLMDPTLYRKKSDHPSDEVRTRARRFLG